MGELEVRSVAILWPDDFADGFDRGSIKPLQTSGATLENHDGATRRGLLKSNESGRHLRYIASRTHQVTESSTSPLYIVFTPPLQCLDW